MSRRRGSGFDTRAGGLLLGFSGVLVTLAPDEPTVLHVIGQVFAGVAAVASLLAVRPRVSGAIALREVRYKYLAADPEITRLTLLDTRILLFEQDDKRINGKAARVQLAFWALTAAVVFMVAGVILKAT